MKNKHFEIKEISIVETLHIRHKVMWPNKPLTYVELPDDKNGKHLGLYVNDTLTSIVSLFTVNNEVQFRKFATLVEFQGLGYGTVLLQKVIASTKKEGIRKLWCNARVEKSKFYEKFGLKPTNKKFEKGGIQYIVMERLFTSK
ncbi:GNAT family N-acetyltransferase [Tenacibaculum soleae]|uniref:GNAT family N-acetyltransferase n=1 Tax=Tenacibaculum soleae TaxID=447689 RepID=UPI0023014CF1|nr:GNAT family N-acetyltransferase [Tenacibaculum soleae]